MIYCIDDTDQEDDDDSYDYWYEDATHNNYDNSLKYKGKDVWAFGIINNHDDLGKDYDILQNLQMDHSFHIMSRNLLWSFSFF